MEKLKRYDLNCNIFDVYDYDGLSMQELLCQFYTKINECVDFSNSTLNLCSWLVNEGLKEEVAEKLTTWLTDGTLENIINVTLFDNLNNKIDSASSQLEQIENKTVKFITLEDFGGKADAKYTKNDEWYSDAECTILATDNTEALERAIDEIHDKSFKIQLLGHYCIRKTEKILINKSSVDIIGLGIHQTSLKFTHSNSGFLLNKTSGNGYIYEIHFNNFSIDVGNIECIKGEQCYFNNISISNNKNVGLYLKESSMMYINRITLLDNNNSLKFDSCGFVVIEQVNIWNSIDKCIILNNLNNDININNTWFEYYGDVVYSERNSHSKITFNNCHILDGRQDRIKHFYSQAIENNENPISLNMSINNTKLIDHNCTNVFNISSQRTANYPYYEIKLNNFEIQLPKLNKLISHTASHKSIKLFVNSTNITSDKVDDDTINLCGINNYVGNNIVLGGLYADTNLNGHLRFDNGTKRYVVNEGIGTPYNFISVSKAGNTRPTNKVMGDLFYDTNIQKVIVFDGGIWRDVNGSPV